MTWRSIRDFALLAFGLAALMACTSDTDLRWTEDVKLPDGRILAISRWVEFKGSYALGDTPNESQQRLEFRHPDTGETVKWAASSETGMLNTVALMMDGGRPMLLSIPALAGDYFKFNCPNPPYMLFVYVDGSWLTSSYDVIKTSTVHANLTTHVKARRKEIEANNKRLSVTQTSDSYTYLGGTRKVPFVIDFSSKPKQTFSKYDNCDKPLDTLIRTMEK